MDLDPGKISFRQYYRFLAVFIICLLGFIIYSNTFGSSFQLDDIRSIVKNRNITNLKDIKAIWDFCPSRFVSYYTVAVNYHFGGLDPFGYHVFNVSVHLAGSVLVWWFVLLTFSTPVMKKENISKYAESIAFLASLIFLTHPLQTQAVTYIIQRITSLAAFFYIGSIACYAKSRLMQKERRPGRVWLICYASSIIMAILAMFTKEMTITLPLMIVMYEFFFFRPDSEARESRKAVIPFIILLCVIPATMFFTKSVDFTDMRRRWDISVPITPYNYFLTELRVMATYIRLIFIPVGQRIDYDYPISQALFNAPTLGGLSLVLAILAAGVMLFRKSHLLSFAIFWFFLALMPESSFVRILDVINEHRMYLPMAGAGIFIVAGAFYLLRNLSPRMAIGLLTLMIVIFSALTYTRNEVWREGLSMWDDVARKSPDRFRAYYNRGLMYGYKGMYDKAIADFNKSIEINVASSDAYNNRGLAYYYKGEYNKAITDFNKAIRISPWDAKLYNNIALAYQADGAYTQAIANYNESIKLNPKISEVYFNKAAVCEKTGRIEDAIRAYKDYISYASRDDTDGLSRAHRAIEKLTR